MNENVKKVFHLIADPIIFGNFFISLCAAGLVLESYVLLGHPAKPDGFVWFVFFSTLALYNFHRLMGVRRIKPEDRGDITGWAARHQFTLLMLVIIGIGGMGFFFFQLPLKIISMMIPLGAISVFYELPLVKYHKKFERIRNLWLSKAFLITLVWGMTSTVLAAMALDHTLADFNVWLLLIERTLFIFILALCFDARDVTFDAKDAIRTIPIVFGIETTIRLYRIFCAVFLLVSLVHYLVLQSSWGATLAMLISSVATFYIVMRSQPRRNDYYYMFLVDGMMLLQFLLVAALSRLF